MERNIDSSTNPTWRWWVLAMLFLAMVLGALDRQALSLTMKPIAEEFKLDESQRGELLAAFMFSYAFCHLFVGVILDRIQNTRRFFLLMVISWSFCSIAMWFAESYQAIKWIRYLLGVAEAGVFPLSLMLIARIFPAGQRAFAAGIFNSGTLAATLLAPWIVVTISNTLGWRASFAIVGTFGLLWVVPWMVLFRDPQRHADNWPDTTKVATQAPNRTTGGFTEILLHPGFWAVSAIGVGIVPSWFFLLNWLPSFMEQVWKLDYSGELVYSLTGVRAAQDLGLWIGGFSAWRLSKRHGMSVLNARKTVICVGFALMCPIAMISWINSVSVGSVIFAMYAFGAAAWLANMQAFKQDVVPSRVATVVAWVGFIETGFAAYVVQDIGRLVKEQGGYDAVFWMLLGFNTFAFLIAVLALRPKWFQTN